MMIFPDKKPHFVVGLGIFVVVGGAHFIGVLI